MLTLTAFLGGPTRKSDELLHFSGKLVTGKSRGDRMQKFVYKAPSTAATR